MTAEYTKIGKYLTEEMLGDQDGGRPVTGFMCIGGRYMVTKNVRVSKGIANSAWVQLVDVILTEDAVVRWNEDLQTHCVESTQVRGVVVLVPSRAEEKLCEGLPVGQFFLPFTDYNFVFRFSKKSKGNGLKLRARGPHLVMPVTWRMQCLATNAKALPWTAQQ